MKTFITGQNNEEFGAFWEKCNTGGTAERLKNASSDPQGNVTHSRILGVSRVEKDPRNRAFDFYIAAEGASLSGFDAFTVASGLWAIFTGDGEDPMSLIRAELETFLQWLPNSHFRHDARPELEVYPENTGDYVEFWLPIVPKE